jgi:hypothetical protein
LTEDVCVNLAHVQATARRFLEAERLYASALKSHFKSSQGQADTGGQLLEAMASVQLSAGKEKDARKTMLKLLHLNPMAAGNWMNLAALCEAPGEDADLSSTPKGENVLRSLEQQQRLMKFARRLLSWGTSNTGQRLLKADSNNKKALQKRIQSCEVCISESYIS